MHVLCPICKVGSLKETPTGSFPAISCTCGFHFQTQQEPLYGVLEDFQEIIAAAFMAHRYVLVFLKNICCVFMFVHIGCSCEKCLQRMLLRGPEF